MLMHNIVAMFLCCVKDEINELQSSLRDVSKRVNALEGSIKTLQEAR